MFEVLCMWRLKTTPTGIGFTASLTQADEWSVSLRLANVSETWNMVVGTLLHNEVQRLVGRPSIPAIPIMHLQEFGLVSVRDLRLNTLENGAVALEFNLGVPTTGRLEDIPTPENGWAVELPSATILGLLEAAALGVEEDGAGHAVMPYEFIATPDGFEIMLRVWSLRRHARFKEFRVKGRAVLTETGDIALEATEAVLEDTSTKIRML